MSQDASGQISTVMQEKRLFPPSKAFAQAAHIGSLEQYEKLWNEAAADSEAFWGKLAEEELHWFAPLFERFSIGKLPWRSGLSAARPTFPTTVSMSTSIRTRRDKTAILWEGEPGDKRRLSYAELHEQVCKFANVLREKGIEAGRRRFQSTCRWFRNLAIAMLACARVGAVHSVIFGGFSSEAIADRNNDASAKMQITADGGWRRGKELPSQGDGRRSLEKISYGPVLHRSSPHRWRGTTWSKVVIIGGTP